MIRIDLAVITEEVMSPCLQGMNYDSEFKIMGWIVFFMWTDTVRIVLSLLVGYPKWKVRCSVVANFPR